MLLSMIALLDAFNARKETDTCHKVTRIKGFYDIIISSSIKTGNLVLERRLRSEQHNGEMAKRWVTPNKATKIQSIFLSEQYLNNQDVRELHLQKKFRLR